MEALLNQKKAKAYAVWADQATKVIDVDLSKRVVTGLYNTQYFFDEDCDVILPGANSKSIHERGPNSSAIQKIKHLKDHDWSQIPAKLEVLDERTVNVGGRSLTGTYFEAKMINTTLGNDLLIGYQEGVYDNHSFGFRYLEGKYIEEGNEEWDKILALLINPEEAQKVGYLFAWKELKMYEGSSVAFGANSLTPYLGVKSKDKNLLALKVIERIDLIEKQLRGGTQSDDCLQSLEMQMLQLKQFVSELFMEAEQDIKRTLSETGRAESLQSESLVNAIKNLKLYDTSGRNAIT